MFNRIRIVLTDVYFNTRHTTHSIALKIVNHPVHLLGAAWLDLWLYGRIDSRLGTLPIS